MVRLEREHVEKVLYLLKDLTRTQGEGGGLDVSLCKEIYQVEKKFQVSSIRVKELASLKNGVATQIISTAGKNQCGYYS